MSELANEPASSAEALSEGANAGRGRVSAGLLVYRRSAGQVEVLLGHPGGPLWARRHAGAWMVPKGEIEGDEVPLAAALREFEEETGLKPPPVTHPLTPLRQAGGKRVLCWAAEGDLDLVRFKPGEFEMQWPSRSGRRASFPEIDRLSYLGGAEALDLILPSQRPLVEEVFALCQLGA